MRFIIKVWNVDNDKNKKIKQTYKISTNQRKSLNKNNGFQQIRLYSSTNSPQAIKYLNNKWYKGLIKPLNLYNKIGNLKVKTVKPIFTFDLETIYLDKINAEFPIAISSCGYYNGVISEKLFLIDKNLLLIDHEEGLKQLWSQYFKYLEDIISNDLSIKDHLTIFAHNLGDFDGYFLYNGLLKHYKPNNVTSIIDESNTFICIQHIGFPDLVFKDSLRIFPMSLDKLCKMFNSEGKITKYNDKFRDINFFDDENLLKEFKLYCKQDSRALLDALTIAQTIYFDKYKVDIESIYSTATLSLKIYRTNFQEEAIFILPSNIDNLIRNAYFGGGTDVYKAYGKNIHYYDVNSLYPFAMLQPMPHKLLNNGPIDMKNRSLDSFFGYILAEIICPLDMLRLVLPYHFEGKTIYPVGTWSGWYFSEELNQ